jgi:RNA polymerase sigma-70 factor (ECF subfamily)
MNDIDELIPTRQSLLSRLKDWEDEESWRVFFETYWRLIYRAAIRARLTDSEAQDVVQETILAVLKSMPTFKYDAKIGSFKGWLMQLTSWRISDRLRKRELELRRTAPPLLTDDGTEIIDRIPDPKVSVDDWEQDWEKNLMEAAIQRVKRKVDPGQYQIFDLYVFKRWPVSQVAKTLKINSAKVYLVKHRITNLIKKEIEHLQESPI